MKKINILTLTLLLLLGFASCQKAEINQNDDQKTHTVTFVAGTPETKTTVDISDGTTAKFAWTKNDESRFEVYENGVKASETIGVLGADGIMTLTASFDGSAPESPSYQALYNTAVSSAQAANDLYDETADVLVSSVLTDTDREAAGYLFSFKRESAIAKMTLKGLTDGVFVSSVTINSDKDIAGTYDLANGIFTSTSKTITIAALSTITGGEATVWFASVPVEDATFTVTATTVDNDENVVATYTKTFTKTITLTRGDVKGFGVAMEKDATKTYGYQKISSVEEYAPGDYIIVAHAYKDDCPTKGDFAISNTLSISSDKLSGQNVTSIIDNDVIYASDGGSYKLTLSGDKDNIVISNGTSKLGYGTSSTKLVLNGDNTTWSLSLNNGNGGSFVLLNNSTASASTKRALAFQSYTTSGTTKTASLKFAAYAIGNINDVQYAALELYKYQEVTTPTPKYSIVFNEVTGGTLSATSSQVEAGAEVTLTATPDEGYAFNDDWSVKDADNTKVTVTDNKFTMPAKDVTVSGSFSKVDYTITKATCEGGSFTVKKDGVEVTKAQIGDAITLEAIAAEGYEFDSWTVTNESTSKIVYVSENTFTMPGANVTVSANFLKADVVPVYASLADLIADGAPTSEGEYVTVTLTNEEITKLYESTTNPGTYNGIFFMVGTREVEIYCYGVPSEWKIGGWVSGTLTKCKWVLYNGSTWELKPDSWDELTYVAPCEPPVITLNGAEASITCATEGATIHYTLDDTDPTEASDVYSVPVTLTDGQTIKAKAFLAGHKSSEVASKTYSSTGGETKSFIKLTSSLTDYSGEYLMLHSNDYVVSGFNSKTKKLGTVALGPKVSDEILETDVPNDASMLTIAASSTAGYYTIKLSDGNYLGYNSSTDFKIISNANTANTDSYLWSISISNGSATITNKADTSRIIKWYSSQKDFRAYTNQSYDLPVLYKKN